MKKLSWKVWTIIAAAFLCVTIILITVALTAKVSVPDLSGKTLAEASKILKQKALEVETVAIYSDTFPEGEIISQETVPGTKLKRGSKVHITVSNGIEQIVVLKTQGLSLEVAKDTLEKQNFKVKVSYEFNDEFKKGIVIAQDVTPGRKAPKGSQITIVVSKGPDLVIVPNLQGKSLKDATDALKEVGLTIKSEIKCSNSVKDGLIISQDTKSGTSIKRNSTVTVLVSAGIANKVGNNPSNSSQWGRVASQGDWVYFSNEGYDYYLYKMRQDGSEKQVITKDTVIAINVVGEWIYYTAEGSNGGLYKIKLDGSQKTKLDSSINYFVHVANGWIYYSSNYGNIYKMKTDGTEKTKISNDSCMSINVSGDWIYYINVNDNYNVYKVRTDGTGREKLFGAMYGYHLAVDGDTIITVDMDAVKKINSDGSGYKGYYQSNKQISYINAYNGWLYILEHDMSSSQPKSAFYKMRYDTREKTKILDIDFHNPSNYFINIAGDWLYFKHSDDNHYLYRVKTDGTKLETVYR